MSFKRHNDGVHYGAFNMMSLLGHTESYGRDGGKSEKRENRDVREEIDEGFEVP